MNYEHLKLMEKMLRNLPKVAKVPYFNLGVWINNGDSATVFGEDSDDIIYDTKGNELEHTIDCGTVACAVGHACLLPEFNELGLKFGKDWDPIYEVEGKVTSNSWAAVSDFFDIKHRAAEWIFDEYSYNDECEVTPLMVADRIAEMIVNGEDYVYSDKIG